MSESQGKIKFVELKGDVCIASATCCVVAGEIFKHEAAQRKTSMLCKDGTLTQLKVAVEELALTEVAQRTGNQDEALSSAAGMCPVAAIRIYDAEGRRLIPDDLTPME